MLFTKRLERKIPMSVRGAPVVNSLREGAPLFLYILYTIISRVIFILYAKRNTYVENNEAKTRTRFTFIRFFSFYYAYFTVECILCAIHALLIRNGTLLYTFFSKFF